MPMKMVETTSQRPGALSLPGRRPAAVIAFAAVMLLITAGFGFAQEADSTYADTTGMMMDLPADETAGEMMMPAQTPADSLNMESTGALQDSTMLDSLMERETLPGDMGMMQPPPQPVAPVVSEDMVYIPAGKLPDPLRKFRDNTTDVAWTNGFQMDKNEVTNRDFAIFLSARAENKMYFDERMYISEVEPGVYQADEGKENYPVVFVSWFGAYAYSQWVGKSLPTEEEWILACLGTYNDQNLSTVYPWGVLMPESVSANLLDINTIGAPDPIGSFPASNTITGLEDMAGNVAEWTLTNFTTRRKTSTADSSGVPPIVAQHVMPMDSTATDSLNAAAAQPQEDKTMRFVIKGGSYLDPPSDVLLNRRATRFPQERYQYVGFRCIRREGTR